MMSGCDRGQQPGIRGQRVAAPDHVQVRPQQQEIVPVDVACGDVRNVQGSQRGPERKPAVTAHSPTATHSQLRARRKARAA